MTVIDNCESYFKTNIVIYSIYYDEETQKHLVRLERQSMGTYESTMYLNDYESHISYVHNLEKFGQWYVCPKCPKHFDSGQENPLLGHVVFV